MAWLSDKVFAIREAAYINFTKLAEVFGSEWAKKSFLPKLIALSSSPVHLVRLTMILAFAVCFDKLKSHSNARALAFT